jgi:hypothetical protein
MRAIPIAACLTLALIVRALFPSGRFSKGIADITYSAEVRYL